MFDERLDASVSVVPNCPILIIRTIKVTSTVGLELLQMATHDSPLNIEHLRDGSWSATSIKCNTWGMAREVRPQFNVTLEGWLMKCDLNLM